MVCVPCAAGTGLFPGQRSGIGTCTACANGERAPDDATRSSACMCAAGLRCSATRASRASARPAPAGRARCRRATRATATAARAGGCTRLRASLTRAGMRERCVHVQCCRVRLRVRQHVPNAVGSQGSGASGESLVRHPRRSSRAVPPSSTGSAGAGPRGSCARRGLQYRGLLLVQPQPRAQREGEALYAMRQHDSAKCTRHSQV